MPVTKVKVNGEWIPAMPVGGGGEGDMTKAVYDTNDDGVVNAADQATKDGSGNVITSTYAAKATTLSGYGIADAKIENGSIILGSNSITPLTSFTETDPVFTASAAHGISSTDITNWNSKSDTDEKVKAVDNGDSCLSRYLVMGTASGNAETKYYNTTLSFANTSSASLLSLGNTSHSGRVELYTGGSHQYGKTELVSTAPNTTRTISFPDKGGTVALASTTLAGYGITDAKIQNGTITLGSNTITPLTSFTETDPVFSASAAAGITSTDIDNWNSLVSDDKTWNGATLDKSIANTNADAYLPAFSASGSSATSARLTTVTHTPAKYAVAKYDGSAYLSSTTPTSTDNSTKVATTAFVQTALSGISLDGYIASDTTANFTISDTAPSNPQAGDLWLDTNSQSASGIAYLPLSAGENHPLTGDLYIDTESGTEYKIVFDENGTEIGKIGMSSDGTMRFWRLDSGNAACGVQCNTSTLNLFASGSGYIVLRPNGVNNQTGETSIDPSGWMNGKGFHATAIASDQVNRMGDMFFYRKSNISGGAMTAGTLKTIDTIATASYRPNGDVDTGFAIGYNQNSVLPLRYGYVRIKADGSVQVSPNESVANSCYWTVFAMWRNPYYG